ncbi:MAG: RNA polymerase sigma factor [Marmoricola sp.]
MEQSDYEEFFRLMYPRLTRFAQRRFSAHDAEELAAKALVTIWDKDLPAPADQQSARSLQSLAYSVLQGHMRNAGRAETAYKSALAAAAAQASIDRATNAETARAGWPDWASPLSLTDRDVLELVVDGFKVAEISVILDCTPAAVSMRLQRAKRNARRLHATGGAA